MSAARHDYVGAVTAAKATRLRTVAIVFYLLASALLAWALRHRLNPDGICYIEVARHVFHGEYQLAVNSWWSPAFSALILPTFWFGADPVLWARLIQIPAGLLFAQATNRLIRDAFGPSGAPAGFLLALCAALAMQTGPITPDIWHAATLTWYFVHAQRLLRDGGMKHAAAAGILGGLNYLVKAYSLPFILLHLTVTLLLRQLQPGERRWQTSAAQWAVAIALLALASAPWVAVISAHDHEITMSSAGRYWTAAQPINARETAPVLGLFEVPTGRVTSLEDIRSMPLQWKPAPPFGSVRDQFRALRRNFIELCFGLDRLDGIGLTKMFVLLSLALIFPLRTVNAELTRLTLVWVLISVFVYLAGYSLTYFVDRFLWAIWGLLILLCVSGPNALVRQLGLRVEPNAMQRIRETARQWQNAALLILGGLILAGVGLSLGAEFAGGSNARAREINLAAKRLPPGRAIAATDWYAGINFAYWNRGRYLGGTSAQTAEGLETELSRFGPVVLLVVDQPALSKALGKTKTFKGIDLGSRLIDAFEFEPSKRAPERKTGASPP